MGKGADFFGQPPDDKVENRLASQRFFKSVES